MYIMYFHRSCFVQLILRHLSCSPSELLFTTVNSGPYLRDGSEEQFPLVEKLEIGLGKICEMVKNE